MGPAAGSHCLVASTLLVLGNLFSRPTGNIISIKPTSLVSQASASSTSLGTCGRLTLFEGKYGRQEMRSNAVISLWSAICVPAATWVEPARRPLTGACGWLTLLQFKPGRLVTRARPWLQGLCAHAFALERPQLVAASKMKQLNACVSTKRPGAPLSPSHHPFFSLRYPSCLRSPESVVM